MSFWDIFEIVKKFIPSRKASLVDRLNELVAEYNTALRKGQDTKAAAIRVQMEDLRKKLGYTEGDI